TLVLVLGIPPGSALASAPSLAIGDWWIDANGHSGALTISTIDAYGNLTGQMLGVPITGYWDGWAGRISFQTDKASVNMQVFTGYIQVQDDPHKPELEGSFEA